jgi:DNA-binding NtrC family response regulator
MTDALARVRAQKALVERLIAERDAAQAKADAVQAKAAELAGLVNAAEDDYIRELITAYDNGVTPQEFFEQLGMKRGSLHWRMNKLNGKGR